MRAFVRRGWSATLLVVMMITGSLVLWAGVPVGGLWVAGRVKGETGSIADALAAAGLTVVVGIFLVVRLLVLLSDLHRAAREARGEEDLGFFPLEVVLVTSASIVLVLFVGWFLFFAGSSPIPVQVSP